MARNINSNLANNIISFKFERGGSNEPTSSVLQTLVRELQTTNQENEIKIIINQIVTSYMTSKENPTLHLEGRNVIFEIFTKFYSKKVIKKYVNELVANQNVIHELITSTTQDILEKIKADKTCNLKKCNEFMRFVSVVQTASTYDFEENFRSLFPLYIALFDSFAHYASQVKLDTTPETEELNTLMNAVLKQILPAFVKNGSFFNNMQEPYLQSLLKYSHTLLYNETIGFDLRMKFCLIFVYSFNVLEGDDFSISQLLNKNGSPFSVSFNDTDEKHTPSDYFIIIYSALLSVLPEEKLLSEKVDDKPLICVLFTGILETAKGNQDHNKPIIVETSRTLWSIAKHLKKIPLEFIKPMYLEGLFYVSSHTDHFIDTVRNYSRLFFEELVELAAYHQVSGGHEELTRMLMEKVDEIPEESTMRFYAYENIAKIYGCDYLLKKFENLPLTLLEAVENPTVSEQVCKTYNALLEKSFNFVSVDSENSWAKTWVIPAINLLKSGRESEKFCQRIISTAFKLQPTILRMIFPNDYVGTIEESKVLLHCLHNARKNGIELSLEKDSNLYWRGLIDKQKMEMFMIHQHEEIRLLVLASIAESLKSTELFLDWEFIFLINYIRYNITAQSPNVRKQIVSFYKKVLMRYDAGYKVITRNINNLTKSIEVKKTDRDQSKYLALYQELKKSYRRFISNFTKILIGNLSYDSNYPRRATSLELLLVIKNFLTAYEWMSCWNEDDVKNSHNILFDTYEGNKKMIVKLLKTLPSNYLGFMNVNFTFKYMQRSFELALDVKPSKTLSAAYLFEICSYSPYFYDIVHCECEDVTKKVNDTTFDMILVLTRKFINQSSEIKIDHISMAKASVYGLILSIRHFLEGRDLMQHNETYAIVFKLLVPTCFSIVDKIMPVVCNPSPEGYLPESVDEIVEDEESPNAQMVLVYAWRTMKEMTLLLAEIVKQTIKLEDQLAMVSEENLIKIGQFFVNVFIQSKHRGVFEQAYVGFSIISDSFWKSKNPKIHCLPKQWLQEAVDLCTGKKQSDDLCATRRSAGLPFLILSIITTEPDPSYFNSTMSSLFASACDKDTSNVETKMHCLNVLRAIFRHCKLGELVSNYVAKGVILAIGGFKSEVWGVRNSSTLLFATLMTRMFGVQRTTHSEDLCIKNKLTARVFFMRYPSLYNYLLQSLAEECKNNSSLMLQPILMILARLYRSNFEEGPQMSKYLSYVNICLSNPEYKIREAAAKASVPLISSADMKAHFDLSFDRLSKKKIKDNECHGILLQLWYLWKNSPIKDIPISKYLKNSAHLWDMVGKKYSHMTVNLYTELITKFLYYCRDYDDLAWLKKILCSLSKSSKPFIVSYTWHCNYIVTKTLLAYFLIANKLEETDITYSSITNEIMNYLYGPHQEMKSFCLQFLIALNQSHLYFNKLHYAVFGSTVARFTFASGKNDTVYPESNSDNHALFYTGELEIQKEIVELANSFDRCSVEKLLKDIHPHLKNFFMEELKMENYIDEPDRPWLFLLLDYYPCAIKFLRLSKQETLNTLLIYCSDCDSEEQISAVITCIGTFLQEVDYNILRFDKLLEVLSQSASPAAAQHRRLSVCDFLCKNYMLYCNEEPVLKGDQLCTLLNIVMVLLEDEDLEVRNAMSNYENSLKVRIKINNFTNQTISGYKWPVVPEKAKEDLIHLMTVLLPQEKAVCLIFSWACRYFPDPSCEPYEIFERGGLNQYAENTPLIDICSRVLIKMLWTLPEGLSYEDKSIFPEEQTQIVTVVLLNSLLKYDSPMMLTKTKMSVICVLKSMYQFLENCEISDNFQDNFKTYLNQTILSYLTNRLEHGDLFCVKKIIRKLYDPVFRQRR